MRERLAAIWFARAVNAARNRIRWRTADWVRVLPAARREDGIELGPLSARDFTSARSSQIESLASRLTDKIAAHIHERMSEKPKFESPQVHQEVGANRPGFPVPTIPRLFSALARKLMVCEVYSAEMTGLGQRTRK